MSKKSVIKYHGREYEVLSFSSPQEGDYFLNHKGYVEFCSTDWDFGSRIIVKPPRWIPVLGEEYFVPFFSVYGDKYNRYKRYIWKGEERDYAWLHLSFVCKTREVTLELRKSILETAEKFQEEG